MTKIFNFALKIKGGGREGGTCEVLRPCHPPPPKFGTCTPSWNCSGGDNMVSSLTLFRGTGLDFTLSHFPVLGGGVGFLTLSTLRSFVGSLTI